jgi:hypothetical protein
MTTTSLMATCSPCSILIAIEIPGDGFDTDEDVVEYRDILGAVICDQARLFGFDKAVTAKVQYED